MELGRDQIERQDFAQARRGYDPEEVDRHLAEVASAVEEQQRRDRKEGDTPSIAGAAADQVRTIVEAAERSAAEIESSARSEAERLLSEAKRNAESERTEATAEAERERSEAATDARRTRDQAESDAREHIARVQEATTSMRSRAETAESDLNGLVEELRTTISSMVESVRTNAGSLESELVEIQAGLAIVREKPSQDASVETAPESVTLDEPAVPEEPPAEQEPGADEETTEYAVEDLEAELEREQPAPPGEDVDEEPREPSEGGESARLIALNMALNGTPREETARYLDENFDLEDRDSLLDDVYARVGG